MFKHLMVIVIAVLLPSELIGQGQQETETIYSGPQRREKLPSFLMKHGFGDHAGQEIDLVEQAGDESVVLVFLHRRSRPAFGLANAIMNYCNEQTDAALTSGICFLTADPTETQNWLNRVQRYFPPKSIVGYSADGPEGPGAYGLNKNVQMTVVVGRQGKVVENFALVQPGAHVDGPRILEAIAKTIGSDQTPDINRYLPNNQAVQDAPIAIDPRLMKQIRQINQQADSEVIGLAIEQIEQLIKENQPLQRQLGTILARWSRNGRIDAVQDKQQKQQLKDWSEAYAPKMRRNMRRDRVDRTPSDPRLTGLLRQFIQKDASPEAVNELGDQIEQYVASNPAARIELARITNTIVSAGKVQNYGTPAAQTYLKKWAEQFAADRPDGGQISSDRRVSNGDRN